MTAEVNPLDDYDPVLSIGSVAGGMTCSDAWQCEARWLMRRVIVLERGHTSPLRVNVVFHIPGELLEPEFEGVRTARFSKKKRLLMIQVALGWEPVVDARQELIRFLEPAIDAAEDFGRAKGMFDGDLTALREIIAAI